MLYSCTHMATMGVKGLNNNNERVRRLQSIIWPVIFDHLQQSLEDVAAVVEVYTSVKRDGVNDAAVQFHPCNVVNGRKQLLVTHASQ